MICAMTCTRPERRFWQTASFAQSRGIEESSGLAITAAFVHLV
jgi:hypothetical protein